jgi:TPR repeat protein
MRTFSGVLAAALIAGCFVPAAAGEAKFASPQAAFEQGIDAYRAGSYEAAIAALEEAAAKGQEADRFFAEFYLARIYGNNNSPRTDHAKAYMLYQRLADENADIDPEDNQRGPFVAKALTALAGYVRRGVEEIGLRPDPERAIEYLQHAATFFGDKDAQFELARHYLSGESRPEDVRRAMHYLSVLTQEGHPAAQALLADLLWRGKHVAKDERRALALITMAVENAPAHERMWIEDVYQSIFCASSQGTRTQASGIIAEWRKIFGRPSDSSQRMGLGRGSQRTCSNGEPVHIAPAVATPPKVNEARPGSAPASAEAAAGAAGFGTRDAGARSSGGR